MSSPVLYKNTGSLKIGDVHRFIITYTPSDIATELGSHLYVKVKNIENVLMNSVLLTGPYTLYCDIRSSDYTHNQECFVTDDQPYYEPNIIPGQSLSHKLTLNRLKDKHVWIVDIISQILFSTTAEINFEILISKTESDLHSNYATLKNSNYNLENLNIQHLTTLDIWNKPPRSLTDPIHLVILTHGLHSNSSADMFYLKEQLELMADKTGENLVVRAYFDNVCKTERGVKYLGRRLAEYIIYDSTKGLNEDKLEKISFISHSLGGPVQTFAISYINYNYPLFFQKIKPENFITIASPLLGISNENPVYVKVFLKFGIVGKTGQDLNLEGNQPLLLLLPSENTRKILKMFKRRTVYANVLNDGIVPLRTSALLYLDWKALTNVYETLHSNPDYLKKPFDKDKVNDISKPTLDRIESNDQASEIPVNLDNDLEPTNKPTTLTDDKHFIDSFKERIQSTIGYCLPNIQAPKTTQKYNYFQTTNSDDAVPKQETADVLEAKMTPIPKSSFITSLKKVLLPPSPSTKYINDPKSRYNVILHDKIYTPDMIPKKHTTLSKSVIISQLEQYKRHRFFEEKIARRWHQGMSWRKVLVYLQPDAHNNIIVRRRFANAYGWQVIDHLVEAHFGLKSFKGEDLSLWELKSAKKEDCDFLDLDESEVDDLNKKFSKVINKEFSKEYKHHIKHAREDDGTNNLRYSEPESNEDDNENAGVNNRITDKETRRLKATNIAEDKHANDSNDENINDNDTRSTLSSDNDIAENDGVWLNEQESIYYDGPTNLLNTVNEGMVAWRDSVMNLKGSSDTDNNPDTMDKNIQELNQIGEMNAYI